MVRTRLALFVMTLLGWLGAGLSQARALQTDDDSERSKRELTRNRFLLLSSISMNSLVLLTIYRFGKRLRQKRAGKREEPPQTQTAPS